MSAYWSKVIEFAIPCIMFWGVLAASVAEDRSRFRNCIYLLLAAMSTVPLLCVLTGSHAEGTMKALSVLVFAALLMAPVTLIANGVIMIRRQGHSLVNSGMRAVLFISLTVTYGSLVFVSFMAYTVLLQIIPRKRDFDFVIIHGSGLLKGRRVSKLLADRIDKAIEVYQKDPTPPVLIPSGGKGSDEEISEAEAMEQYLLEHGIPKQHIVKEDRSTTTRENLIFSKKIIEDLGGPGYTALVTSNYHVYRALNLCREIGLECTGIGAHVAPYYWPSALIREFAAIMSKKVYLLIFALGWAACVLPAMYEILMMFGQ